MLGQLQFQDPRSAPCDCSTRCFMWHASDQEVHLISFHLIVLMRCTVLYYTILHYTVMYHTVLSARPSLTCVISSSNRSKLRLHPCHHRCFRDVAHHARSGSLASAPPQFVPRSQCLRALEITPNHIRVELGPSMRECVAHRQYAERQWISKN